ncbi:MAG TPA: mucoidy inhibitor MuiA family protein, partial [Bacteroidia bacterium]|nr:mucoidy inhibitor MuiA family protein [Bacteroidia bacterium]
FALHTIAQEKSEMKVKTDVKAVTVFMNGAQVTRRKVIELPAGKSVLKFILLSPYLDEKSIQVKTTNDVVVLSVNHQFNYTDSVLKNNTVKDLNSKLDALETKMILENTNLEIIKEQYGFLYDNRILGGKNQEVNFVNLKQTADYYNEKIAALKMKEIETAKKIKEYSVSISALKQQINREDNSKIDLSSEILINVDVKNPTACEFELKYVVQNAGWYPSYDVRAKSIEEPVELRYKANIHQNTKEDWKNVQLKLSSSDPNAGSVAPELKTYYLDYNTMPPKYAAITQVNGKVIDSETKEGVPFATVIVEGTTVGTTSNADGGFSLALPPNTKNIIVSYIGYEKRIVPVTNSFITVALQPGQKLEETVVTEMAPSRDVKMLSGKVAGVQIKTPGTSIRTKSMPEVEQTENQTSFDFDIKEPYTIGSDNKNITVDMDLYSLPAFYEYYSVPKIDKDAFLIASILDWEQYNLLAGEANIFFENTFVGKSILDVKYVSDTLKISLGRDKNIIIKREKGKNFTSRQFIGNKKEETRDWQISVKNNKKQTINLLIYDQVPVSTNEQIEVITDNVSGGDLNKENGEVKWKFTLNSLAKKEFNLKYRVKYPKERVLLLE